MKIHSIRIEIDKAIFHSIIEYLTLKQKQTASQERSCNGGISENCPLYGKCVAKSTADSAKVESNSSDWSNGTNIKNLLSQV